MPPFYVITQGAKLRLSNRRLVVELEGETLSSAPLAQIDEVVLFGNVGLTTPAIDALLAAEIEVTFLTQRGEYRGHLQGPVSPHVAVRRAQYTRLSDPAYVLEMARGFVAAKLHHLRTLLLRHNRELNDPQVAAAAQGVAQAAESLAHKTNLPALLGCEGVGTRAYFAGYRRFFGPEWRFDDRNRRPPRDPVNVLLSFGYTLLAQAASGAVQTAGLDPYAGFLHEYVYNRPALALDLLEEFRPVVDGVVLWCCRSGALTPADFTPGPPERPIELGDEGRRRFIQAYEQRLDQVITHPGRALQFPLRQCLVEQARQIAGRINDNRPGYTGMGFR